MNRLEMYQEERKDLKQRLQNAEGERKVFLETEIEEINKAINYMITKGEK